MTGRRLINPETLGAWVIKCQPKVNPGVTTAILDRDPGPITRFCVADNYRSRMMAADDPAILWISGDGRQLARGIWGLGRVTGPIRAIVGEVASCDVGKLEVPLHIELLADGVSVEAIRAAGVGDLEVLVQPQASNPSWVSRDQLAALAWLLDWPTTAPS